MAISGGVVGGLGVGGRGLARGVGGVVGVGEVGGGVGQGLPPVVHGAVGGKHHWACCRHLGNWGEKITPKKKL